MGAVGGLLVRQLVSELADVRGELAKLKSESPDTNALPALMTRAEPPAPSQPAAPPLVKQPALWFAIAGWAVAGVLLFRRRSI
jgi:hypothetical protein